MGGNFHSPFRLAEESVMKIFFVMMFIGCFFSFALADEVKIPFSCWPLELQKEFSKLGKKLDLKSEDRTEESWGYLFNEGNSFKIYTYNHANEDDLESIRNIVFNIELKKISHGQDDSKHADE